MAPNCLASVGVVFMIRVLMVGLAIALADTTHSYFEVDTLSSITESNDYFFSLLQISNTLTQPSLSKFQARFLFKNAGNVTMHETNAGWTGHSYFLSNDLSMCAEGTAEVVEGALALKKAGLEGGLYNNTFAHEVLQGKSCNDQGYTFHEDGFDDCYPGIRVSYKSEANASAFSQSRMDAINAYGQRFGISQREARLMRDCTCHPQSTLKEAAYMECSDVFNGKVGSWVHHDPADGSELMCDGGPFLEATFALAVLKSTGQLPMHQYDQIQPVSCDVLGFPHMFSDIDHCFAGLHMWFKTDNIDTDPGAAKSSEVEDDLFDAGGMSSFVQSHHLNGKVLNRMPGCHCSPHSGVGKGYAPGYCDNNTSPIRSWWEIA